MCMRSSQKASGGILGCVGLFLSAAAARGYREVTKPKDPTVIAKEDDNITAYSDLMFSCEDDVSFEIVEDAISRDFPEGDARKAWEKLCNKYEPKTGAAKVQL